MDYSAKGILVLLQDLQRIHFGKVSIYIDVVTLEDAVVVACCVFDRAGEPHTTNFYSYEGDDKHKEEYIKVLGYVNENTAA